MFEFNERELKGKLPQHAHGIVPAIPKLQIDSILGDYPRTNRRKNNSEGHSTRSDAYILRPIQQ